MDSRWNQLYRLMDVVRLHYRVVPFRRFGKPDHKQAHLHLFEESTVESATKDREQEFKVAELNLITQLQSEGISREAINKVQLDWEIRLRRQVLSIK